MFHASCPRLHPLAKTVDIYSWLIETSLLLQQNETMMFICKCRSARDKWWHFMHIFKWKISFFSTERGSFYLTTHTHTNSLFCFYKAKFLAGWVLGLFFVCLLVFFLRPRKKKILFLNESTHRDVSHWKNREND